MTSRALIDATLYFFFYSNPYSTEEPKTSNIHLEYLCGELYPFIKPLPLRDKQSESFISIYYKPPQFLIEDKDVLNLPHDKTPVKNGYSNEPINHGEPNSSKMLFLN